MPTPGASLGPIPNALYPSIPHLPGSRTGPSGRALSPAAAHPLIGDGRRAGDEVVVQEKLDGSCVLACNEDGAIVARGRRGDRAAGSRNEGRRRWAAFVEHHHDDLAAVIGPGERLAGEWLALAHGTRYELPHGPFVCFDLFRHGERVPIDELTGRVGDRFPLPGIVHRGGPIGAATVLDRLGAGFHGAVDPVEGAVWRLERTVGGRRRVVQVAKFVRPGKVDGRYLPDHSGRDPIWLWREAPC